jgi:hypothetical protein
MRIESHTWTVSLTMPQRSNARLQRFGVQQEASSRAIIASPAYAMCAPQPLFFLTFFQFVQSLGDFYLIPNLV